MQLPTGITVLLSCRDRAKTVTCPLVLLEEENSPAGAEQNGPDSPSAAQCGTRLLVAEPLVVYSLPGTGLYGQCVNRCK